jgi:Ca2+-binding RTX toxin-like protein
MHTHRISARRTAAAAAAVAISSGMLTMAAPAASAQAMVVLPPGCGSDSGTLVLATDVDDHSGDPGPIVGPYQVTRRYTIGTAFDDIISGRASGDVICGRGGHDQIFGNQGIDELLGNAGEDIIEGATGNDDIFGGGDDDFLYGDTSTYANGLGDSGDEIQGAGGNDVLQGGAGDDMLRGGAGNNDEVRGGVDLLGTGGVGDTAVFGENCIDVEVVLPAGSC